MKHIIKSRLKKGGIYINNFIKNYFLAAVADLVDASRWIANLGVVPLFLFAAFLLAPAFFIFLNLLFVVTHVLETIRQLLSRYRYNISLYNKFKPYFLPIKSLCVKEIVIFTSYVFWLILPMKINAQTLSHDIILARGQSTEVVLSKMDKFNIGNHQVVSYRLNEKTKTLLIRGTQIGHSEILVWNHDKSCETYQVFIVSKNQEAKFLNLAELTSQLGLSSKILMPNIKVSGELKTYNQYLDYKKILEQNKDAILDEVEIATEVKNKIIALVYSTFFEDYKDSVKCSADFSEITCFYPENESPNEVLKKYLTEKYKINLIQKNNQQFKKNYSIKMKLIQLEQLDGEDLRLGLEQVSGSLRDFLTIPIEKIVQKNQVLLAQKNVKMSTLAEPQSLIRPQTPAELQIGADIPFKTITANNTQGTDWKFAGLKIKLVLENFSDQLKINYETELTQPMNDSTGVSSIGGNKEKSSVVIPLKSAVKMFQISLKTEGNAIDKMPFLSSIPILGELFKSRSNQSNFKTITGIIEVTENEE